jgi:hypothetical protein
MNHIKFDSTPEQRILINAAIDYKLWNRKFQEDKEAVIKMKSIVEEFKI